MLVDIATVIEWRSLLAVENNFAGSQCKLDPRSIAGRFTVLRVLLISALPDLDPACGDVTYTQTLLNRPPEGVIYDSYGEALKRGSLREHYNRQALVRAYKENSATNHPSNLLRELTMSALCRAVNVLRQQRAIFWEPFRFFSVKPGAYDLVHAHVFPCHFVQLPCPLVVSLGAPQRDLYLYARGLSSWQVNIMETVERSLAYGFGINTGLNRMPQSERLLTYTHSSKDWFANQGVMPLDKIDIVPICMEPGKFPGRDRKPRRIGFVAKDFAAKGGPTLLAAFRELRQSHPTAELYIVGCPPLLSSEDCLKNNITWIPYVKREELYENVLPSFDVFAYPTTCDCISFALLEAMSIGLPIATSDYPSMPEAVDFGRAGLISPIADSSALATNLKRLLDPQQNESFRKLSYEHFLRTYSTSVVMRKLKHSYELAIADRNRAETDASLPETLKVGISAGSETRYF